MILKFLVRRFFSAKRNIISDDFMIIARVESLILDKGLDDARSFAYVEAGADGIMIHSRKKTRMKSSYFSKRFRKVHLYELCQQVLITY